MSEKNIIINCNLVPEDILLPELDDDADMEGVKRILISFHKDVAKFPERRTIELESLEDHKRRYELEGDIVMKDGKRMIEIGFYPDDAELIPYPIVPSGSKGYRVTIELLTKELRKKIIEFAGYPFTKELVCLVLKNDNNWHFLGEKYRGASIETSGSYTNSISELNMKIVYITPLPQYYIGDIDSLLK